MLDGKSGQRAAMTIDDLEVNQPGTTPIDELEAFFSAHGWSHDRIGEEEVVAVTPGAWGQYELRGIWREDDRVLQFLALPDIKVTNDQYLAIYETIGLINEQLWIGHFELWSGNGALVFRHATLLEGQDEPSLASDQAESVVDAAIGELDRFYPVFQFVMWGGKSPAEAIAAAMVETHGEA
jgi:hypothetical protein